jgi:FKBP-type peptidyl-prolyl cis-trans isomerase (trigger factor)
MVKSLTAARAEGASVEIGSGRLIPGFEDQLVACQGQ